MPVWKPFVIDSLYWQLQSQINNLIWDVCYDNMRALIVGAQHGSTLSLVLSSPNPSTLLTAYTTGIQVPEDIQDSALQRSYINPTWLNPKLVSFT
jgi:hypothetical protein